jgi:hypothetical protein
LVKLAWHCDSDYSPDTKESTMGLFDFFKRKPASKPPQVKDDGPSPDYAFAHFALRFVALSEPLKFLAIMVSPDATNFIDSLMKDVEEQCGKPTTFPASSVKIHAVRVNDYPCAVIELPEPKEIAEAHMVAIVVPLDMSADKPPEPDSVKARFFTLEKGVSFSNEPRTVLAEWDTESHSNYGSGPPVDVSAFVSALSSHM